MTPDSNLIIAIIGGGASGVLTALHLLESVPSVTLHLYNGRFELGGGVAYSVTGDDLLLNVAASCMSARSRDPLDFYRWLEANHPGRYRETSFVPRRLYREYLSATLLRARDQAALGRLQIHAQWVNQILPKKRGFLIQASETPDLLANAVVLALGNCLCNGATAKGPKVPGDDRYISNPWHYLSGQQPKRKSDRTLVLGSGLTAVDVIVRLLAWDDEGKIEVFSRRGRWPATHAGYRRIDDFKGPTLRGLSPRRALKTVRAAIEDIIQQGGDWRQVIEGLRAETNAVWAGWNLVQRSSFLRHVRPYWDTHRHRMAPEIAAKLNRQIVFRSLQLKAARVLSISAEKEGLRVTTRRRGSDQTETAHFDLVINCTGSEVLDRSDRQALVEKLLALGLTTLDPFLPGLATNEIGELIDETERAVPNLFAVGPVRRGTLWETTAVPEIRAQAEQLARDLMAHVQGQDEPSLAHTLPHAAC